MQLQETELTPLSPDPITDLDRGLLQSKSHDNDWVVPLLRRAQRYSAYGFLLFLGIHACLVLLVPALPLSSGLLASQTFAMARAVYLDTPGVEPLLVIGSAAVHITCGVCLRIWRAFRAASPPRRAPRANVVIKDGARPDVGLGGMSALLGLGYRTAWIARQVPGMLPLSFSGYILALLVTIHACKFRGVPYYVDGDSSSVGLEYVAYSLAQNRRAAAVANSCLLYALVTVAAYHVILGWLRFTRRHTLRWKRAGYVGIVSTVVLAWSSLSNIKHWYALDALQGFLGKAYARYSTWF